MYRGKSLAKMAEVNAKLFLCVFQVFRENLEKS